MIPYICSHTRTGTHLLASLLFRNLECGVADYETLHYSHTRVCDQQYIHLHRPVLPVMLSIWRMRERFGIHASVSFAELIRVSYDQLKRSDGGAACINGTLHEKLLHAPKMFYETFPKRWLDTTTLFAKRARLNIAYVDCIDRPYAVVQQVAGAFHLKRKGKFQLVQERVGWQPAITKEPIVTEADLQHLERYQCLLSI